MKKLAIIRKHYSNWGLNGTPASQRVLKRILTKKFIRRLIKVKATQELGIATIVMFMRKDNPVINSQSMIDYIWDTASPQLRSNILCMGSELTYLPTRELLDRDWDTIPNEQNKVRFTMETGFLPYEERIENKGW